VFDDMPGLFKAKARDFCLRCPHGRGQSSATPSLCETDILGGLCIREKVCGYIEIMS